MNTVDMTFDYTPHDLPGGEMDGLRTLLDYPHDSRPAPGHDGPRITVNPLTGKSVVRLSAIEPDGTATMRIRVTATKRLLPLLERYTTYPEDIRRYRADVRKHPTMWERLINKLRTLRKAGA